MNNTLFFLRHANTQKKSKIHPTLWGLSDDWKKTAWKIANIFEFQDIEVIICSEEMKTYLTVKPLADKLWIKIKKNKDLNELKRTWKYLTKKEFDEYKRKTFEDLDFKYMWAESWQEALDRFVNALEKIQWKYLNKKILISSHWTILSLYFAYIQNKLDQWYERFLKIWFGSWGTIKKNSVIKDII